MRSPAGGNGYARRMPLTPFLIVFFVFAGLCVLLALSQGFAMRRCWRERRRFAASHRLVWLLVFLLLGTLSGLLGSALLGYRRLTSETVLADLSARQLEPRRFAVRIDYPDGNRRSVEVFGEQWQLDARVIKWKPSAVAFGLPALYRIERISGRYIDTADEATQVRSAIALETSGRIDLFELKQKFPRWMDWLDADYGSAAYLPLVDGGNYRVSLSPLGGLIARPADSATEALLREAGW
jgi:hypothetical protein